jgi:hypothetical protein
MEDYMRQRIGNKYILTTNKPKDNENIRTGLGADAIAAALIDNLHDLSQYLEGRPLLFGPLDPEYCNKIWNVSPIRPE